MGSPRRARPVVRSYADGRARDRVASRGPDPVDAVRGLVGPPLADAGYDLESLTVSRAGSRYLVTVAVDRDGGLDLDAVAEASRVVSDVLDASEVDARLPAVLRGAYTLEVSSRGATAPLTAPRHWRRAVGRLVEVRLRGRADAPARTVTGRITATDDDGAGLDAEGMHLRVEYPDVVRAVVQLEFRRPPGGADAGREDDTEDDAEGESR